MGTQKLVPTTFWTSSWADRSVAQEYRDGSRLSARASAAIVLVLSGLLWLGLVGVILAIS